ncbi:MAG: hypothetical protein AAFQ61_02195 [Cyanobacteria bacterium J06626_23]
MANANNLGFVFDSLTELLAVDMTALLASDGNPVQRFFAVVVDSAGRRFDYVYNRAVTTGGLQATGSGAGHWFLRMPGMLVGEAKHVAYPVTVSSGLYQDENGHFWYPATGGSIGSASSGADAAAAVLEKLFEKLWAHLGLSTPDWAIQTSSGGASTAGVSAQADWDADKRLIIPDMRGRGILGAGQGSGLTDRAVGDQGGAETHALTESENGPHNHPIEYEGNTGSSNAALFVRGDLANSGFRTQYIQSSGSGTPHNIMGPWKAYTELWYVGV